MMRSNRLSILPLTALLLAACSAPDDPAGSASGVLRADGLAKIDCPETAVTDPDHHPEYDSWLSMKGGSYGHIVREWHDGCEQQLSFPAATAAENPGFDEPQGDYKPVYSPDGQHIAFFRRYYAYSGAAQEDLTIIGDNVIPNWRTSVMLMNAADGSGLRALTDNEELYVNPMWTRRKFPNQSGGQSYRVTFTRGLREADEDEGGLPDLVPRTGVTASQVCWTDIDAQPGQERCFTDADAGNFFGYSSLKDGRILVRNDDTLEFFLVTPNEDDPAQTVFEPLRYDGSLLPMRMPVLHKVTISPDETRIAYMKVEPGYSPGTPDAFGNAVIAYAELDLQAMTISNEVLVTERNLADIEWYPSWSQTNKQLVWFCSGNCPYWTPIVPVNYYTDNSQVLEYDLESRQIRRISHHLDADYRYPDIWGTVK